ncbi:folate-binding protein YgfZ [Paucibacter sp. KBW04]|nr:folate-binding protein YgfZ [Paucibacter sp. KBW04]
MIIKPMSTSNSTITTISGALRLSDWGLIRAEGPEAAKFLHGQLTQDFELLGPGEARLAGFCTAKGRLLATLIGWKSGAETVDLALPLELLPAILKRLSMFVLRAKCKLRDATAEQSLWGLSGTAAQAWLAEAAPAQRWGRQLSSSGASVVRLPDATSEAGPLPRFLLAQAAEAAAPALPELPAADWQWQEVQAGLAWVRAATSEAFVPQMLNLELLEGVNFKKGCYPGQEIVARSQYRGTLKRRTHLFELAGSAQIGQEIFHSEDPEQPAGLVAAVAQREGQSLLLAEVKIAALESGSLHLGAADGPALAARALPYAIPLNSEV